MNKLLNTKSTWFGIMCTVESLSNSSQALLQVQVAKQLLNYKKYINKCKKKLNFQY